MKRQNRWQFRPGYKIDERIDPRTSVVQHIGWNHNKISGHHDHTIWSIPEPDNYTHSIWDSRAHFIEGINYQCWYKNSLGWFSLFLIDEYNLPLYKEYQRQNPGVQGYWSTKRSNPIKKIMPTINYELHLNWGKLYGRSSDERLYDQGVYDGLIAKGADPDFLYSRIGVARPLVIEQEEEIDEDV